MTNRLILVCHASTSAVRQAAFPLDEPLDQQGAAHAAAAANALGRVDAAWCGPSLRCRQTAGALGLNARIEPALRGCAYGRWQGQTLADLEVAEPEAVTAWLADPAAAPHGGESLLDLSRRVGAWLDTQLGGAGRSVAVTDAAVIRSAIIHAIQATPASFWRIDVAPLSRTVLHGDGTRWRLRIP